jgi:hypothetical protein
MVVLGIKNGLRCKDDGLLKTEQERLNEWHNGVNGTRELALYPEIFLAIKQKGSGKEGEG